MALSSFDSVLVIGGGHMGGALLRGWLKAQRDPRSLYLLDTDSLCRTSWESWLPSSHIIGHSDDIPFNEIHFSCIVLAVKPQQIAHVVGTLCQRLPPLSSCIVSVAAGIPLASIAHHLGHSVIIRAMPNLACAIGKGITALYSAHAKDTPCCAHVHRLFACLGMTLWLEEEERFDIITALCGSGPAYLYYFLECLTKAGAHYGLSEADAQQLALSMVDGATALAIEKKEAPRTLRARVTSPQGTTAAAIDVFQHHTDTWDAIIQRAIEQAMRRAKQLAEETPKHTHAPSP
ncbi:MAG: pyrroline-5-carboxylate reductase [Alphaproteobacteria bacterium GM7ARS4]|nr:pyrroline-5-carboxylate reductase [Alphaproteobacteria bacterium GM7ARS4]